MNECMATDVGRLEPSDDGAKASASRDDFVSGPGGCKRAAAAATTTTTTTATVGAYVFG